MSTRNKQRPKPRSKATSLPQALRRGVELLNRGRGLDAEKIFRDYTRQHPEHGEAHHLLGVALHQSGRHLESIPILERAVQLEADHALYRNTLGEVLRITGSLTKAIQCYRKAVELEPKYAQAFNNLGIALQSTRDTAGAIAAFEQALALDSDKSEVLNNLGVTHQAAGNLEQAIQAFEEARRLSPKHALAIHNLATACKEQGQLDRALALAEETLTLAAHEPAVLANLGDILSRMGQYERAIDYVRRAVAAQPKNTVFIAALERIYRQLGNMEGSVEQLRKLTALEPRHAGFHNDLGMSLLALGEIAEAQTCFMKAIELAPRIGLAYENYSRTKRFSTTDSAWIERLHSACAKADKKSVENSALFFAMGKTLDDLGDYDEAFQAYRLANELQRSTFEYQPDAQDEWSRDLINIYSRSLVERVRVSDSATRALIFVCGMPRSGTSLVEQILASHPEVHGAGELPHVYNFTQTLAERASMPYPLCAEHLQPSDITRMRDAYLSLLGEIPQGRVVVDKAPMNFFHIGLISAMFPEAKIVVCERDHRDVGLSLFFQHFAAGNFFAYDLYEIGRFYRQYEWMMRHWREVCPDQLVTLNYQGLIENQRDTTRELLANCSLDWHDACLDFHRTRRAVRTASAWQVRHPIASHSVGRWKHYESHLEPLLRGSSGAPRIG